MNVKDAIAAAKAYINDVYAEEDISNLGLEETEYDDAHECWYITLAFSRPWNSLRSSTQMVMDRIGATPTPRKRSYKVITVSAGGIVTSMKNRQVADAD